MRAPGTWLFLSGTELLNRSTFGIFVMAWWGWLLLTSRDTVQTVPAAGQLSDYSFGIALLVGVIPGMIHALSLHELRRASFVRILPGLAASIRSETLTVATIVSLCAVAIGCALTGPGAIDAWLFAVFVMLGYTIAVFMVAVPAPGAWTAGLAVTIALICIPEVAAAARGFAPLVLLGIPTVVTCLLLQYGSVFRDGCVKSENVDQTAPRGGQDLSGAMMGPKRSTDWDWVCASMLEMHGGLRTSVVKFAFMAVSLAICFSIALTELMGARTKPLLEAEIWGVNLVGCRMSLGMFFVGVSFSLWPLLSMRYPLSRQRKARVIWLQTQLEDLSVFAAVFAAVMATKFLFDWMHIPLPWALLDRLMVPATLAFVLLPLVRHLVLEWRGRASEFPSSKKGDQVTIQHMIIPQALLGLSLPFASDPWAQAELYVRGVFSLNLPAFIPVAWLPLIVLLRWFWWLALKQHFKNRDLPTY